MEAAKTGWNFFQNEILGMKWLNRLIGGIVEACGLDPMGRIGGSIQFFFYDVMKIMVLLGVLILIISYIQSYFPPERTKRILGRFHGIGANCIAALLGTVTPFCSCSSIPLFIGFTSAGLPLGVTFSFLISSPMVDLGTEIEAHLISRENFLLTVGQISLLLCLRRCKEGMNNDRQGDEPSRGLRLSAAAQGEGRAPVRMAGSVWRPD